MERTRREKEEGVRKLLHEGDAKLQEARAVRACHTSYLKLWVSAWKFFEFQHACIRPLKV